MHNCKEHRKRKALGQTNIFMLHICYTRVVDGCCTTESKKLHAITFFEKQEVNSIN